MPIPMPLHELSDAFLYLQLGFKWHFGFEDYMVTSSDKDIPAFEDMPY